MERKEGGTCHLILNIYLSSIVHKYLEGKVKRTLERGLKDHEIVEGEVDATEDLSE